VRRAQAGGKGFGAVLWAETESGLILGGSALGGKGVDAVMCGRCAAEELVKEASHGGCVDTYTQDQVPVHDIGSMCHISYVTAAV
jgi:RNA 3'-terminal phosphate cyclase (ATP)